MTGISLPEWIQGVTQGGAIVVLLIAGWLFVTGKLFSLDTVNGIRTDAEKRVAEVEKRVASVEAERDRLLTDRARLMDLLLQYKYTAAEAINHIPDPQTTGRSK